MKVLLVGANGTIGSAIYRELKDRHEVITAGRTDSDIFVDITSPNSIKDMYLEIENVDAVICAAGTTFFGPLTSLTPECNETSIHSKLKGQVNLVLLGHEHVNDKGSFTLTTGVIMDDPVLGGVSAAMVSGALKAFVESAAFELPRGIRINNVSPNVVAESIEKYGAYFPGFRPVLADNVAKAYQKSVEGIQSGKTYRVY